MTSVDDPGRFFASRSEDPGQCAGYTRQLAQEITFVDDPGALFASHSEDPCSALGTLAKWLRR